MTYHSKYKHKKIIDQKSLDILEKLKVKCDCGHSLIMTVQQHYTICTHCGKRVNNNSKDYFIYQLRKAKERIESNEKN